MWYHIFIYILYFIDVFDYSATEGEKMKLKKLLPVLVLLVAAALFCTACKNGSSAASSPVGKYARVAKGVVSSDGFVYDLYENGEAITTGTTLSGGDARILRVPAALDSHKNVAIADYAFASSVDVEMLFLPQTVVSVGASAFEGCSALVYADLGAVFDLGPSAFFDCRNLSRVDGTALLASIGSFAFYGCTSLSSFDFGEKLKSIGAEAFCSCASLGSVRLPDSLTSVGDSCFAYCTSLSHVEVGGLTAIPEKAFLACTSLSKINLGKVVTVGVQSFRDCRSLELLVAGKALTSIGDFAFSGCELLADVNYAGKSSGWKKIAVGEGNEVLTLCRMVYGAD